MKSSAFRSDCLADRTVLITGGAGAIGRVVVQALAEHGARVAVNDILLQEEGQRLVGCHERIRYFHADVTDESAVVGLYEAVRAAFGLPTVVCCHAGVVEPAPYNEVSVRQFDRTLAVNLKSAFLVSREAVRRMAGAVHAERPGRIIFTSSWVQDVPWPDISAYVVSKSGMKMLMKTLAREVGARHILINSVAPGIVNAGMAKRQWNSDDSYRRRARRAIPLGFLQPPESIADAFIFLASDASNYMTGSTLLVDGGCSLYPMDDLG